jgi:predicted GIY-YIG superfamily endonuclease
MKSDFDSILINVKKLHEELIKMTPVFHGNLGDCNFSGVYLFTENKVHLYMGRTRGLRKRLMQHASAGANSAPFALRLTREITGHKATYKKAGSIKELMTDGAFLEEFKRQQARVAQMEIRYIRVDDDLEQALLEIYSSTVLETPHNEFRTT